MHQSAIGKLLFLSTRTRPDIAFAVSNVAKFANNPTELHWKAVKHIIRYLAGTVTHGIQYQKGDTLECHGYSDSDWAGIDDRKSTSGYGFLISSGLVSWKSCKQTCVALSTSEAEYMALSFAAQEAIWIRNLLSELQREYLIKPAIIFEDNQSSICLSKNPQYHGKSKHISI